MKEVAMSELVPYREPATPAPLPAPETETSKSTMSRLERGVTHGLLALGLACLLVQYDNAAYPHGPINWMEKTLKPNAALVDNLGPFVLIAFFAAASVLLGRLIGKDRYARLVWLVAASAAALVGCLNALRVTRYVAPISGAGTDVKGSTILLLAIGGGYIAYLAIARAAQALRRAK